MGDIAVFKSNLESDLRENRSLDQFTQLFHSRRGESRAIPLYWMRTGVSKLPYEPDERIATYIESDIGVFFN